MTCDDFLDRYSDFRDGELALAGVEEFQRHLSECAPCNRYDRILNVGTGLLRDAPSVPLRENFHERIRFGIYREEVDRRSERSPVRGSAGLLAGVGVAAAVAAAMVLVLLREAAPAAELQPIAAAPPISVLEGIPASLFDPVAIEPAPLKEIDFLAGSNVLLYERSELYRRHREAEIFATGLR